MTHRRTPQDARKIGDVDPDADTQHDGSDPKKA